MAHFVANRCHTPGRPGDPSGAVAAVRPGPQPGGMAVEAPQAGRVATWLAGTWRSCTWNSADRQIIVEVFPPGHRRALRLLDRQIIVEIGGGSEPSSNWRIRPEPPVPCRNEIGVETRRRAIDPAVFAGISRLARRAGSSGARLGPARLPPGSGGATAAPPRDEGRPRLTFISSIRWRHRDPQSSTMICRFAELHLALGRVQKGSSRPVLFRGPRAHAENLTSLCNEQ